jgi:hypothetical protein
LRVIKGTVEKVFMGDVFLVGRLPVVVQKYASVFEATAPQQRLQSARVRARAAAIEALGAC